MLEGRLLNERYLIKHIIGGGGMANVYKAHDLILKRDVAIKIMRLDYANDPEFIERFDREAQAATSLSHPNVVNIYDVGEEDNILFIVMELVDGLTLKEYIKKHGPLQVEEAVKIMIELTSAINHAHENNLIHRDIKPQNILLDKNGTVKVTDFGIAIALSATALTQTNSILGSVHYLSPEQARGGIATKKSDIYSLGIVFYELLTGELPFSGETAISIALKHLQIETPSVKSFNSKIPQSVENIVKKATDKDPIARFSSVSKFKEALLECLDPSKINEPPYQSPVQTGEETKAIPLYNQFEDVKDLESTMLPQNNETTKNIPLVTEPDKRPKKKKRWKKILLILLLISFITTIGVSAFIIIKPKDVVIPDVKGLEYEEARDDLEELKLKVDRELVHSEELKEGLVVKSEPKADNIIKEKSVITLFVSEGEEPQEFENYVGQEFLQVEKTLQNAGFSDVIKYEKTSEKPKGQIINQIQPKPKKEVIPSETTVIFEVSQGPEIIVLDDFIGRNKDVFIGYAKKHNLKTEITEEYSDTVDSNYIIKQNPSPGTNLEVGSTVSVIVSKGEKEVESRTHSVTFTVPFEPKEDEEEQEVVIYVDDLENKLTDVYKEEKITEEQEFTIKLKIEKDKDAEYKVERDGEKIIEKTISYKEGS